MKSKEGTLDLALEAFWAKVAELHPERESGDLDPTTAYDLEIWAAKALDVWLEMNKPVYYVQRTMVQVVRIVGETDPDHAVEAAKWIQDADRFDQVIDTETDYIVLDKSGKVL